MTKDEEDRENTIRSPTSSNTREHYLYDQWTDNGILFIDTDTLPNLKDYHIGAFMVIKTTAETPKTWITTGQSNIDKVHRYTLSIYTDKKKIKDINIYKVGRMYHLVDDGSKYTGKTLKQIIMNYRRGAGAGAGAGSSLGVSTTTRFPSSAMTKDEEDRENTIRSPTSSNTREHYLYDQWTDNGILFIDTDTLPNLKDYHIGAFMVIKTTAETPKTWITTGQSNIDKVHRYTLSIYTDKKKIKDINIYKVGRMYHLVDDGSKYTGKTLKQIIMKYRRGSNQVLYQLKNPKIAPPHRVVQTR